MKLPNFGIKYLLFHFLDAQSVLFSETIDKSIETISANLVNGEQNITDELKKNINDSVSDKINII